VSSKIDSPRQVASCDETRFPTQERDEYSLLNIYDLMSGYLEAYFEQRILFKVTNRYRPNLRMNGLDRLHSIDVSKLSQLQKLYGQTSRKGSRHSQPQGSVPRPTRSCGSMSRFCAWTSSSDLE
jgi:hypothetical protein